MAQEPDRRAIVAALLALAAAPAPALGRDERDLDWAALMPQGDTSLMAALRTLGVVAHDQAPAPFDVQAGARLTHAHDGRLVRLAGFATPLDDAGQGASLMLLTPFIGACMHVPPPPLNQTVLVTAAKPHTGDPFLPIVATGRLQALAPEMATMEVGYGLTDALVAPQRG